jgi:hypothetical protein
VKAIRLEAPSADLFRRVVEARLRPCLDELPDGEPVADIFPFADEQVMRIARTEPTLRDMLQQCRHLFDHLVYGPDDTRQETVLANPERERRGESNGDQGATGEPDRLPSSAASTPSLTVGVRPISDAAAPRVDPAMVPEASAMSETASRIAALLGKEADETPEIKFKQVDIIEAPADPPADVPMAESVEQETALANPERERRGESNTTSLTLGVRQDTEQAVPEVPPTPFPAPVVSAEPTAAVVKPEKPTALTHEALAELWEQEQRAARRKLEPEGALTGATRELQAGLGAFLGVCHEHGVKVGPWRLQHVVAEWTFGDHPTYGAVTIAHWACKGGQPWKVGLGLFLARGAGKPKDLEVKLAVMDTEPAMVDHLILLRPEDDLTMTGKSKTLWADAERRGKHARLEPVSLEGFAQLYSFPRWLAAVRESLPEGTPLPNLADVIQEKCEKLLEQVCMPVQG